MATMMVVYASTDDLFPMLSVHLVMELLSVILVGSIVFHQVMHPLLIQPGDFQMPKLHTIIMPMATRVMGVIP